MASCNLNYSGHTGVINAAAYVYEQTTSGTTRSVRVILQVYAVDYSGARDGGYSVSCSQSGTNVEVPTYSGFTMTGSAQTIFDQTFNVSIARGSNKASISLSFSAWVISPSAGTRKISGTITQLTLTTEPAATASIISCASSVQMGKKLLISIDADNSSCTHTLKYTFGGSTTEIATGVGSSYEWTVPDLAAKCNNATSGSCTITCTTYLSGSSLGSDTSTVTLTVQDATTPSISGGEVTLGQTYSISCIRNSANFTMALEFEFKGTVFSLGLTDSDSVTGTADYELASLIPNLTRGTGTLKCTTMNGTAVVGIKTTTVQIVVPENDITQPAFTIDDLLLTPITNLSEEFSGMYMRGKTGLKAEMSASSKYSTIQSYAITVGGVSAQGNPAIINLLVNEGDVKVIAKVTDARGFSTTVTTSIYIMPYRNPKVTPYTGYSDVICERATETGELSASGTYLAIKAGKNYSSVTLNGVEKNSCELRYRWKPNGSDAYSDWIILLEDGSTETEVSLLVGNVVSSLQRSYLVQISAVDALDGEHTLTFQIMTEAISFVLYDGPDGAGFGKYPEEPHVVDIASHMTLRVRGKLEVPGEQFLDLGLSESVSESNGLFGQIESGCKYMVSHDNCVTVLFNCSFSFQGHFLRVNETPIPEKYRPKRTPTNCFFGIQHDQSPTLVVSFADADGYIWIAGHLGGNGEISSIEGHIKYYIF